MNDTLTKHLDQAIEAWAAHEALADIDHNLSAMWLEQCLIHLDRYFDSPLNNPRRNVQITLPQEDLVTELMNRYDQAAEASDQEMMNYYLHSLDSEIERLRKTL